MYLFKLGGSPQTDSGAKNVKAAPGRFIIFSGSGGSSGPRQQVRTGASGWRTVQMAGSGPPAEGRYLNPAIHCADGVIKRAGISACQR